MACAFAVDNLTISSGLAARFVKDAIVAPTPVQAQAIPAILSRRHAVVQSGTGTGKTLAYVLPLLQAARADADYRAVVVAPSPELAVQILRVVESYGPDVKSLGLVGGGNIERQKDKLKKHPQILVGTPGRVLELIFMRKIKTAKISTLVLDEIDAIASQKNHSDLTEICSRPEFVAQVICASATIGEQAKAFIGRFLPDPARIVVDTRLQHHGIIRHAVYEAADETLHREDMLVACLDEFGIERALVFVNKLYAVGQLYNTLTEAGIPALGLSSERSKQERQRAITAFSRGDIQVLVATDTAARGLDIKGLTWVIHCEAAHDAETYLHRAGRVGRAGLAGTSLVLAKKRDMASLKKIASGCDIEFTPAHSLPTP